MQLKYVWIALADEDGKKNSLTGKLRATVNNTEPGIGKEPADRNQRYAGI